MKKNQMRNKIPPLSSYLDKSQNNSFSIKKVTEERNNKNSEFTKNSSIDYEDLRHNQKFNMIRKLSRSSHMGERIGNFSKYMSNIRSSENIYKDMNIMNAPSFNKNFSEIHQIIKGKKYKNIKLLDSMFFNSGFPSDYLDDFNKFKQNDFPFKNKKHRLRPIQRNNSCEELIDVSKKLKNIIKNEETQQLSTNFSKGLNQKKNNSKIINNKNSVKNLKNNTSSYSTTTNKSVITSRFPELQSNSNSKECINEESANNVENNISFPKIKLPQSHKPVIPQINSQDTSVFESEKVDIEIPKKENTFVTSLNTEKMRFKINQLIIENNRGKEKIDKLEEKILKLKIFQTYQKESLEKLLNDDRLSIQDRIDHIIKMYKIYENIYTDYSRDLDRYINFLFKYSNDVEIDLRICSKKEKDLNYEIEVLVDRLVTKQKDFEYLINTRNFIFWVKNRGQNIINMNNAYVYRISKRRKFVEALFDLLGRDVDSFAFKYLKRIMPAEQLETIITKKRRSRTTTRRANTRKQTTSINNTTERITEELNLLSPPPPGEKIFESPEEFLKVLDNFNNHNIDLLKNYEIVQIEKRKLIKELNEAIDLYEKYEKSYIFIYMKMDEKSLEAEKRKFYKLSKKYDYIKSLLENKNDLSSLKQDFKIISFSAFNNIYFYNLIKYNKLRIQYKYEGLVFLEKLINITNSILSMNEQLKLFDLDEVHIYIPYDILKLILRTKKENFNENNQYIIKEYTLKLIKLYEFICEFILNKNEENKIHYKDKYTKIKDEVQIERKIYNTKIIKKMLDDRREAATKKLMEKWNKKTVLETRKSDLFSKPNFKKNMSMENIKEKIEKVDEEQEEYNLLVEEEF